MLNSILAIACLAGVVYFFIDLKTQRGEWKDEQRKKLLVACAAGAVFFAWSATWHPILVRSAVALVAMIAFGLVARDWHQRCIRHGAILTRKQRRRKQTICIVTLLIVVCMLIQIAGYKMVV